METDLEFVRSLDCDDVGDAIHISGDVYRRLLRLAETAALIVEHPVELHSVLRDCAVAAKIGEGE